MHHPSDEERKKRKKRDKLIARAVSRPDVIKHSFLNGERETKKYPEAIILKDRFGKACGIRFVCTENSQENDHQRDAKKVFENLYEGFDAIRDKYMESMSLEHTKASKSEHPIKDDILYRFDFHIAPLTFEKILQKENHNFYAYRQYGSISRLLNPSEKAMKPETLCLFPVHEIGDGMFILRNAGCNVSETIGVQLAEHMNELLHMGADSREFYNHHGCVWLENQTIDLHDDFYSDLAAKLLGVDNIAREQNGETILSIPETHWKHIKAMDAEALTVYRRLASTDQEELPNLLSAEIPISLAFKVFYEELENSLIKKYDKLISDAPQDNKYCILEIIAALDPSRTLEKAKQAAIAAGAEIEEKYHPNPKAIISALSAIIPYLEKDIESHQAALAFEQSQKPRQGQFSWDFKTYMRSWEEDISRLEKKIETTTSKIQAIKEFCEKIQPPSSRPRSPRP